MINFLEETEHDLVDIGKNPEDIEAIFSNDNGFIATWKEFIKFANFEYDNEKFLNGVVEDLIIEFSDKSWLSRNYAHGFDYWQYNKLAPAMFDKKLTNSDQLKEL